MITIPKPCHENWADMTPKEKGRLCDKCCKVVVDFTKKTTTEIVGILQASAGTKVCGRFRKDQVIVPATTTARRLPRYRVFAAAALFVFGAFLFTSCRSHQHQPEVMGKISAGYSAFGPGDSLRADTPVKKTAKEKVCRKKAVEEPPYEIMGDVAFDPGDTLR